jgi:hypothetical protein
MPTLPRNDPYELRGEYNAKKRVNKMERESNFNTKFSGPPMADADTYTALTKALDSTEIELDSYAKAVQDFIDARNGEKQEPNAIPVTKSIATALKIAKKISLGALPADDIQTLLDYKKNIQGVFVGTILMEKYANMDAIVATPIGNSNDRKYKMALESIMNTIERTISPDTELLFIAIGDKIDLYNMGVAPAMTKSMSGGGVQVWEPYAYDGTLRYSPMFQTSKYAI